MEVRDKHGVRESPTLGKNDLLAIGGLGEGVDAALRREAHDSFGCHRRAARGGYGLSPESGRFVTDDNEDYAPAVVGPFEFVTALALNGGFAGDIERITNFSAIHIDQIEARRF